MLYLNREHVVNLGTDWMKLIEIIRDAVDVMDNGDFAQPVKPYLRYKDIRNRIIAMPAYVGGKTALAGIKWISSFPGNILENIPRAHSVTILNEEDTGRPLCTINTNIVSAIRTAAVSGLVIGEYTRTRKESAKYSIGIIGFGPIGRTHLKMIESLLHDRIENVYIYDVRKVLRDSIETSIADKIIISDSWQACYANADIFVTCTVSDSPYIDRAPKKGSLQLNVSLRDYLAETQKYMDIIIVDDWDEVCRQNTDIENMHKKMGLQKEQTLSLSDIICHHPINIENADQVIMFNPMGMAIFDIAVGGYYYRSALEKNVGMLMAE